MKKTILITGSTDGIGEVTAGVLAELGHTILVHGRSQEKVDRVVSQLEKEYPESIIDGFVADLSEMDQVKSLGETIKASYKTIDVIINNAGVFVARERFTKNNLELRFAVNTIAPYLLTKLLLPVLSPEGRVINLSSAAQSSVNIPELTNTPNLSDNEAYAQSKLAITMWSTEMARQLTEAGSNQIVASINPKSFLGSKMVREAYGSAGHDLRIGADILMRGALSEEFVGRSGQYFDNDQGRFARPHPDATNMALNASLVETLDRFIEPWM